MIYHNRHIEPFLRQLFQHFPIVAVLGARQVGKSTLVGELFRDQVKTIVFDPVEDIGQARQDPDFFLQNNPPPPISGRNPVRPRTAVRAQTPRGSPPRKRPVPHQRLAEPGRGQEHLPWPIPPNFYHYRTHAGAEVDLLLETDGWLFPIEIKSKSHPSRLDTRSMRSFRESFPQERVANGLIVCAIEQPEWIAADVLAVPWWAL